MVLVVIVVQSLWCVWLFANTWTAAFPASLSFTISWSLLKLMSIESVMPYRPSHPLSSPSPLALNLSQHPSLFQWVGSLHQVTKVLELQLQLCFNHLFYLQIKCADYMIETLTWLRVTFSRMRPSISPKHLSGRLKISKQIDLVI